MRVCVVSGIGVHYKGRHIMDALRRLGHEVWAVDDWNYGFEQYNAISNALRFIAPRFLPADRALRRHAARRFAAVVREARPDVVLVTRGDRLGADALEACRTQRRPRLVLWASDSVFRFPEMFAALRHYDDVFVKDSFLVEELHKFGFPHVQYLGQCCAPDLHHPLSPDAEERRELGGDVAVVGSMYPERIVLLEAVQSLPLRIWMDHPGIRLPPSSPLHRFVTHRKVSGPAQTKVFAASALVLNTHHPQDIFGVNLRTFEAAGCGSCQLVDAKRDLDRFFTPDEEVVVYRTPAELVERARWLLARPEERRRIGERAAARAHGEHTYDHRMAELLKRLGTR